MRTSDLLERYREEWEGATRHPFLDGVREGGVSKAAFDLWLAQDYLFVEAEVTFLSRLLPRAPRRDQSLIIAGLAALEEEMGWFEEQARRRGLALAGPPGRATLSYRVVLRGLADEPYPAAITALWAIERAYLEAWRGAAPGHPDYREFVGHWSTPEFAGFVSSLEEAADGALASGENEEEAGAAFLEVARLEREFWEMALAGGRRRAR